VKSVIGEPERAQLAQSAEGADESPVAFKGFVGPSTLPGYVRLYVDRELVTSVEIPRDIIVEIEEETPLTPENPWGKSVVWVDRRRPSDERPLIGTDVVRDHPDWVRHRPLYWPPPPPPPPPGQPK